MLEFLDYTHSPMSGRAVTSPALHMIPALPAGRNALVTVLRPWGDPGPRQDTETLAPVFCSFYILVCETRDGPLVELGLIGLSTDRLVTPGQKIRPSNDSRYDLSGSPGTTSGGFESGRGTNLSTQRRSLSEHCLYPSFCDPLRSREFATLKHPTILVEQTRSEP